MRSRFVFRGLSALLLVAVLIGAGVLIFNAGVAQGLASSGAPDGAPFRGPWPYFFFPPGIGLLFLLCLVPLILFPLFGAFGWRAARWGKWGKHRGPWEEGVPPRFEEWHRRAHEAEGSEPEVEQV